MVAKGDKQFDWEGASVIAGSVFWVGLFLGVWSLLTVPPKDADLLSYA